VDILSFEGQIDCQLALTDTLWCMKHLSLVMQVDLIAGGPTYVHVGRSEQVEKPTYGSMGTYFAA
jgi:hypothetical protein